MSKVKYSEKDLAKIFIYDLHCKGWTIYPELCDIDIVAIRPDSLRKNGKHIIGIECKKTMNLTVLCQADSKKKYVDSMYVGVAEQSSKEYYFGLDVARNYDFGVMSLNKYKLRYINEENWPESAFQFGNPLRITHPKEIKDRKNTAIDKMLHPKAQDYAEAGQAGGKHWSIFKKTVHILVENVTSNPGQKISEYMKNIPHHYADNKSAASSIRTMVKNDIIKELVVIDGCLHLK